MVSLSFFKDSNSFHHNEKASGQNNLSLCSFCGGYERFDKRLVGNSIKLLLIHIAGSVFRNVKTWYFSTFETCHI